MTAPGLWDILGLMNEGMENLKQIAELEERAMDTKQLKRIADAIEEILRLIKKDMREIKKAAK